MPGIPSLQLEVVGGARLVSRHEGEGVGSSRTLHVVLEVLSVLGGEDGVAVRIPDICLWREGGGCEGVWREGGGCEGVWEGWQRRNVRAVDIMAHVAQ